MVLKDLKNITSKPGIYIWKDKDDNLLYVGKAKNLKKRMQQYFIKLLNSYKTASLVKQIHSYKIIVTSSEKEALILEKNYIKKYLPKFNVLLTDHKNYPYIQISLKDKLYVKLVYKINQKNDLNNCFFGPFPYGYGAQKLVNLIIRLTHYKDGLIYRTNDLNYWKIQFQKAQKILSTKNFYLIKQFKNKMLQFANQNQFEVAQKFKEVIFYLQEIQNQQIVEIQNKKNWDILAIIEKNDFLFISMFFYRNGFLLSKKDHILEIYISVNDTLQQFIDQYYFFNFIPDKIITNILLDTYYPVFNPQKGLKRKILNLALKNAQMNLETELNNFILKKDHFLKGYFLFYNYILKLSSLNHFIMLDSSSLNNTNPVAFIVSYRNGLRNINEYKKYKLQINKRKADVDYLAQAVRKYFLNTKNDIPELIILDGGISQVREIKKTLQNLDLKNLKVIGLVKNSKHQTEYIINLEEEKIKINDSLLLNFLKAIQIEVDFFAKKYHAKRRIQKSLEGKILQIKGIGLKTEQKLLKHFKTYAAIYNAQEKDIQAIIGLNLTLKLKKFLNNSF